jgi:hypothetical protein
VIKAVKKLWDLAKVVTKLNSLPVEECKQIMINLANGNDFERQFISDALFEMQDIPDERWVILMTVPELEKLY